MRLTLKNPIRFDGVGLHSGERTSVQLLPAPSGTGYLVRFGGESFQISQAQRSGDGRGTVLSFGSHRLMTVEHMLASLRGLGVDDVIICPDGIEAPLLDGSGLEYCQRLAQNGFAEQPGDRDFFCVAAPVAVQSPDGRKVTAALPDDAFRITYTIDYSGTPIGTQTATVTVAPETFIGELAQCRTFCLEAEVEAMRAAGLGFGGTVDTALVVGSEGPLGGNELRCSDEYVRHKMFDFVGDLTLIGRPLKGHFIGIRAGHAMHLKLVDRLGRCAEKC